VKPKVALKINWRHQLKRATIAMSFLGKFNGQKAILQVQIVWVSCGFSAHQWRSQRVYWMKSDGRRRIKKRFNGVPLDWSACH